MSALIDPADLTHEIELVWLEEINDLDYVRQHRDRVTGRNRKPAFHRDGRLVGYAVLGANAKASRASGTHLRRVFWLAPHDRDSQPDGIYATGAPSEAVDPRTIAPGAKGYKTERSEGGPASDAMREMGITLPKA
ncbi:DUF6009 family protein [Streptomyces sp. NPDC048248]|uniref:DUF6009 family protein n=1 Tax=Streptomyces sp. NPDC048248 TaxID=3365523 RepID=UPI003720B154